MADGIKKIVTSGMKDLIHKLFCNYTIYDLRAFEMLHNFPSIEKIKNARQLEEVLEQRLARSANRSRLLGLYIRRSYEIFRLQLNVYFDSYVDGLAFLHCVLYKLSVRSRTILMLRFAMDKRYTYKKIGEELNISKEWARRLEIKALVKLARAFSHLNGHLEKTINCRCVSCN